MKGEFVGKCRPARRISVVKGLKYEDDAFNDDDDHDDEDEEEHNNNDDDDDVDKDVGQVPVADDILRGLSFLFQKNGNASDMQLERSFSCTRGRIFSDRN